MFEPNIEESVNPSCFNFSKEEIQYLPFSITCPKCHRLFTKELEEKEFVNHEFVMVPGEPSYGGGGNRDGWKPYFVRKELSRYRYKYKCKHCGHEWAEIRTVETDA